MQATVAAMQAVVTEVRRLIVLLEPAAAAPVAVPAPVVVNKVPMQGSHYHFRHRLLISNQSLVVQAIHKSARVLPSLVILFPENAVDSINRGISMKFFLTALLVFVIGTLPAAAQDRLLPTDQAPKVTATFRQDGPLMSRS